MLTLRLKPEIERRLESLAQRTGRTKTFYATKAIEERLDEFDRLYPPVVAVPPKDIGKVKRAIKKLRHLRKDFTKHKGMTLKQMIAAGRKWTS
jgi:RHH-type rel operon transcriptional repressor/antitoxin RelB